MGWWNSCIVQFGSGRPVASDDALCFVHALRPWWVAASGGTLATAAGSCRSAGSGALACLRGCWCWSVVGHLRRRCNWARGWFSGNASEFSELYTVHSYTYYVLHSHENNAVRRKSQRQTNFWRQVYIGSLCFKFAWKQTLRRLHSLLRQLKI